MSTKKWTSSSTRWRTTWSAGNSSTTSSVWPGPRSSAPEDETQFLEIKSILVQELELILASVQVSSPTREEIHSLVGNAPSLRYLSEMNEGVLRNVENQWHKIYIGWHAILGQLKVRQRAEDAKSGFASMFGKKT